jgi:hypothetical protein
MKTLLSVVLYVATCAVLFAAPRFVFAQAVPVENSEPPSGMIYGYGCTSGNGEPSCEPCSCSGTLACVEYLQSMHCTDVCYRDAHDPTCGDAHHNWPEVENLLLSTSFHEATVLERKLGWSLTD